MIQVDVFWSFAMGASLATAASDRLKAMKNDSLFVNRYFVFTLAYLSMIFAPSGAYLLWEHTAWETLFFFDRTELHGMLPCLFAFTNVLLGVIGFILVGSIVRQRKEDGAGPVAHALWTIPYICMFSILCFGYDRFLYTGTLNEWRKGVKYPLTDFFSSQIFYTLLVMGVFVIPPLYYAHITWPAGKTMTADRRWALLGQALTPFYRVNCIVITGYVILWKLTTVLPVHWGADRLFAFVIGQTLFGLSIFAPLCFIPIVDADKKVKMRRD